MTPISKLAEESLSSSHSDRCLCGKDISIIKWHCHVKGFNRCMCRFCSFVILEKIGRRDGTFYDASQGYLTVP